jgi:F0F1-type ATP synthase delta subunit
MALELQLPLNVVGPSDVMRLRRMLEQFDNERQQATLRAKSGAATSEVSASQLLRELAAANKRDLAAKGDRESLLKELEDVLKTAPTITMSFATEPSAAFMAKMTGWFRQEIHPSLLIRIGLQPNIAAGCTVRASGKLYDFSLRGKFSEQRTLLIEGLRKAPVAAVPAATAPTQGVAA